MLLIQHEAVDVLNITIGKAGGITNAKKIAAVAEAAGLNTVYSATRTRRPILPPLMKMGAPLPK